MEIQIRLLDKEVGKNLININNNYEKTKNLKLLKSNRNEYNIIINIYNIFIFLIYNGEFKKLNRVEKVIQQTWIDGEYNRNKSNEIFKYVKNLVFSEKIKNATYQKIINHLLKNDEVDKINYEIDMYCLEILYIKQLDSNDVKSLQDIQYIFRKVKEKVNFLNYLERRRDNERKKV
jgi:hypothetical protein